MNEDTYTTEELCARYHCTPLTLRRLVLHHGFTPPERIGKGNVYSRPGAHQWERIHKPGLHPSPVRADDQDRWDRIKVRRKLQALEMPPPKKKRKKKAKPH